MLTQRAVSSRAHVRAEMPPREADSAGWKLRLTESEHGKGTGL